jgi:hypothetical protein
MGQPTNLLLGGQAGLLGADPELYRQQLIQQEQARVAAMPAQNQLAATLGGLLGRGVSNVAQDRGFFEVTNPVLQKLTDIQGVYNRALQDSDPNDPLSFYKNLQTGFANAGLGQQALMAGQEFRKAEDLGLKTEAAKLDLYAKNPDLLQTQIAQFRDQGNDKKANELAGYLGKITAKQDLDRAKEVADIAYKNAATDAQKASAARQRADIEGGKTDWKVINDPSGQPVAFAILDKKTKNITYEKIGGGEYIPTPTKTVTGDKTKGLTQEEVVAALLGKNNPAAGAAAQPVIPAGAGSYIPVIDTYTEPPPYPRYSPPTVQMAQ